MCIKVKGPVRHELEKCLNYGTWSVVVMDRVFGMKVIYHDEIWNSVQLKGDEMGLINIRDWIIYISLEGVLH